MGNNNNNKKEEKASLNHKLKGVFEPKKKWKTGIKSPGLRSFYS